jgi:PleD family two-component response regulator
MPSQNDQDERRSASLEAWSPAGLRVLVVDDDKLCLKVIAKMLQQCNYEGRSSYHVLCFVFETLCVSIVLFVSSVRGISCSLRLIVSIESIHFSVGIA